jgi:hypothetical protein
LIWKENYLLHFEKIIESIKFEKKYRLYDYDIISNQISFSYNERISKRIEEYFNKGVVKELTDLNILTPSNLIKNNNKKKSLRIVQPDFEKPIMLNELTPGMRKDAAQLILKLSLTLDKYDLMICEGSLAKIFFNHNRQPYFYDLAGIVKKKGLGFHYASFNKLFLNFLRITNLKPTLSNSLQTLHNVELSDYLTICTPMKLKIVNIILFLMGKKNFDAKLNFINNSPVMSLFVTFNFKLFFSYFCKFFLQKKTFSSNISKIVIKDLLKELKNMKSFEISQRWTNYYGHIDFDKIINSNEDLLLKFSNQRENSIIKLISNKEYKTLLDIGANGGYFSVISGLVGLDTVAMDNDIGALEMLHNNLKKNKSLPIIPVVKSFTALNENELIRFKADVVLALGFIHHMRLVELLTWEDIAERLFNLTNHILIIEFKQDTAARGGDDWKIEDALEDYSITSLEKAFSKFFGEVKKIGKFSALGFESKRIMFLCKR